MGQRRAVSKAIATRYKRADKAGKGVILNKIVRDAQAEGAALRVRGDRGSRLLLGGCWAVFGAPTGTRLAPVMDELIRGRTAFESS